MLLAIPKTGPTRAQPEGGLGTPFLLPDEDALPTLPDAEYHVFEGDVTQGFRPLKSVRAKTPKQPATKVTEI